jgi:hypothetical protein
LTFLKKLFCRFFSMMFFFAWGGMIPHPKSRRSTCAGGSRPVDVLPHPPTPRLRWTRWGRIPLRQRLLGTSLRTGVRIKKFPSGEGCPTGGVCDKDHLPLRGLLQRRRIPLRQRLRGTSLRTGGEFYQRHPVIGGELLRSKKHPGEPGCLLFEQ